MIHKDAIRASFVKCGIALLIDGSQDALMVTITTVFHNGNQILITPHLTFSKV